MADLKPSLAPETVAALVKEHFDLDGRYEPLPGYIDQNFLLHADSGRRFVVKISDRQETFDYLEFQGIAVSRLKAQLDVDIFPEVVKSANGESVISITDPHGDLYWLRALSYVEGDLLTTVLPIPEQSLRTIGSTFGEIDLILSELAHPSMTREFRWDLRQTDWLSEETWKIPDGERRAIVERHLLQFRARMTPLLSALPMSIIHNDANAENILVEPDGGEWRMSGLLDYSDMIHTYTVAELAILCAYLSLKADDPLAVISALAAGYHSRRPLDDNELEALFPLTFMRLCVSVTMSAIAAIDDPENDHTQVSAKPAWRTIGTFSKFDWATTENAIRVACGLPSRPLPDLMPSGEAEIELAETRRKLIGPSLSLSHDPPLVIVKGRGQYLFDNHNSAYLDCVNNVCHVGHSEPAVVAAMSEQALLLNTNTRYLHPKMNEYAGRLTGSLPDALEVCYFVNSGSEANELALRLAQTHTGRTDVIVLDDAYHGSTGKLVEMSPYKCEGPGGQGLANWAHKVSKPDSYRGEHRGSGREVGAAYAAEVAQRVTELEAKGSPVALFISESLLGCGGQIVLPDGYLQESFAHVRAGGGLCAVDEVQVGFGRVGSHMWAFETQGVVPDIVTLGKPMGNGHPIGAVITTRAIAESFDNGMEFFNTFGGNPVSCAVGLAVLDLIEEAQLQQQAARVGAYLLARLGTLKERHSAIGDVRGLGMFIGIELVLNRETLEPAPELTASVITHLKSDGILISSDGPLHNVLKIKPPLTFDEIDADLLVGALERAL